MAAPNVVLVSKPLGPPWNNGSSKLVAEIVDGVAGLGTRQSVRLRVFGKPGYQAGGESIEVIAQPKSERRGNRDYILHLLRHQDSDVYHFFFAPHLVAVAAARAVSAAAGTRMLQTVCSQPRSFRDARRLCVGEKIVALSSWTKERLVAAGVASSRIEVIYPPLRPLGRPETQQLGAARAKLGLSQHERPVIFPGDAEPGGGLETFVRAVPHVAPRHGDVVFIIACRNKTPKAARALFTWRRFIECKGLLDAVRFVGELDDFHAALAVSELCVLPASSLYAKVDFPYAVLEAISLGTPAVVAQGTPVEELVSLCGGITVPRRAPRALAGAMSELLSDRQRLVALGQEGSDSLRAICDPDKIARQYLSLFHEVA